jgi:hypothetical protein
MSPLGLLYLLAALLALASALHIRSWARKYILIRLFRRDDLPKLFGGTEFTVRTLRFAWHLTVGYRIWLGHRLHCAIWSAGLTEGRHEEEHQLENP